MRETSAPDGDREEAGSGGFRVFVAFIGGAFVMIMAAGMVSAAIESNGAISGWLPKMVLYIAVLYGTSVVLATVGHVLVRGPGRRGRHATGRTRRTG